MEARKSRDSLTFVEKRKSGNGGERGNVVRIMREEMRREDNKEPSSETNHSCLSQLKAASAAPSLLLLIHLLQLFIPLFGGQVSGSHTFT